MNITKIDPAIEIKYNDFEDFFNHLKNSTLHIGHLDKTIDYYHPEVFISKSGKEFKVEIYELAFINNSAPPRIVRWSGELFGTKGFRNHEKPDKIKDLGCKIVDGVIR